SEGIVKENPKGRPKKQATLKEHCSLAMETEGIPEIPRGGEGEGESVTAAEAQGAHGGGEGGGGQAAITVMHWTAVDICGARSWG
ncbi:hypothetical protein KR054_005115, partial [Drosophila jambulina]